MAEEKKETKSLKLMLMDHLPGYNTLVKPLHLAKATIAGVRCGFPARKLKVIGVTGTNGKTTTCFMIWKMLNESGRKCGLLTTVAWGYKRLEPELNHMTTVDPKVLNERIKRIKELGADYLVLETTSHALSQFRTLGIPIEVAVFTNLTHEHLDYHKTIEKYRNAKCKLFRKAKFGVVNADDRNAKAFMRASKEYVTYGIKNGKIRAKKVELSAEGISYACDGMTIKMKIPGEFNVYNSLAAVAVGQRLGLEDEEIEKGLWSLESVEGRMMKIDEGQNFTVIVDYAHTPDALEKVFDSVKGHKGTIISVHGGAGRRDESTRPIRGEILGKNSDIVIVTEDDSRDEDPEKIAEAFVEGAKKAGKKTGKDLFVEIDRGKAIEMAIKMAKKGDLVLLLGKGHEKTILRKEGPVPFEDIKVAKKVLKKLK
jgi:UDP-N-acetylmuramoyl-L-alanyl-D-glutamate--2,6-diaminopimelate ligase